MGGVHARLLKRDCRHVTPCLLIPMSLFASAFSVSTPPPLFRGWACEQGELPDEEVLVLSPFCTCYFFKGPGRCINVRVPASAPISASSNRKAPQIISAIDLYGQICRSPELQSFWMPLMAEMDSPPPLKAISAWILLICRSASALHIFHK